MRFARSARAGLSSTTEVVRMMPLFANGTLPGEDKVLYPPDGPFHEGSFQRWRRGYCPGVLFLPFSGLGRQGAADRGHVWLLSICGLAERVAQTRPSRRL
jgi:hypothetical protein